MQKVNPKVNPKVKPKKHLGQHFLTDADIARDIVGALTFHRGYRHILEIGPGMGVLTDFLLEKEAGIQLRLIDIDPDAIAYLKGRYPGLSSKIIEGDFLKADLGVLMGTGMEAPFAIIGNFPYNISSQIFFKILEHKNNIPEIVCMLQKEVAERIASPPGSKAYGILSVLLQAFYQVDYIFTVPPAVFDPPPKVSSAVIRLKRNNTAELDCGEKMFFRVVKQAFQTRRKTLRNALKTFALPKDLTGEAIFGRRAEQLSVGDFVWLTKTIEEIGDNNKI